MFQQRFEALGSASLMSGYDVVACQDCGFVFAVGIPAADEFRRYYAEASKYEFSHAGGKQHSYEVRRLADLAGWIGQHCPRDVRLIDVGCATGELLVQLREQGFTSLTGLDPSEACVRYGSEQLGLRINRGLLDVRPANERPFDVLVLSAVLEHIPDLDACIQQMASWVGPEGRVVLEVPDAVHFADAFNAPYQEFSVEHINFFSAESLTNLMEKHGFRVEAERHYVCNAGAGVTGAGLTMIFQSGGSPKPPVKETASSDGVRRYLTKCTSWIEHESRVISGLVATQEPILVWGTGTLCRRLLATTPFRDANIVAFIDSNPHYQGMEIHHRQILAPAELTRFTEPVLITSWAFQAEIENQIRNTMGLTNRLIGLIPQGGPA
jgi:2-polyprenyl-3-methyl-5-hydroxy-6-metoxy-1,4-benzoquinol methylase